MLLAVLAPCAALRTRSPVVRSSQPVLRALRGGATTEDSSLLWVRNGTSALQVVRSLSAFCEEHGLDEEAMLAVSRGEADDHDGWTCGAAQEYDPPPAAAVLAEEVPAAEDSKEGAAESAEGEASEEEAESVAASPPPVQQPMSKMIVGLVAPLIVLQILKAFDQNSPEYLVGLRAAALAVVAFNTIAQMVLEWRIRRTNDKTAVKTPMNPLSMIMGGTASTQAEQTAAEYDLKQLSSQRNSYRMGLLFNAFLHLKMKMNQPLVYSSVSGVVDLWYNPLVQIHLFGQKADGPNARPFGGPGLFPPPGAAGGRPGAPSGLEALLNASRAMGLGGGAPPE